MNKRGDTTVWHEIVKAIPAIMLVLILLAAGVKIYNSLNPDKYSVEKKDLLRIVSEVKDLKFNTGYTDSVSVPIFSKNYTFKLVNTASSNLKQAYSSCNLDYCACFFKDNKPVICETFNLRDEFMINGNKCSSKDDNKDYKGVTFSSSEIQIDKPIILRRTGACDVTVSST